MNTMRKNPLVKSLLFLLAVGLLSACSTSQKVEFSNSLEGPASERDFNNESQATKYSSYQLMSDLDAANYTDIHSYIRSKVSGTNRGVTSVNSGTDPIYVVDGIQVSSIDGMSPIDIYSVEFIKDASASIYGFRGVNGVFNIVTKAGHAQKENEAAARELAKLQRREARAAARAARKAK